MFYMYIAICFLLLFRSILTVDKTRPSKLLVLYVGGFRPDYLDIDGLKGFRSLINNGVNVEYLDPVFPTLTFPNYYSIVTGMYPEKHGLISDYMFDPLNYETFEAGKNPESTKSYWWNSVEPIWISTSKLRISTYMELAYGCQVAIKNEHPVYCRPPNNYGSLTMSDVCDGVSEGVKRIADGSVDFVFTYIDHVNTAGRKYGPFDKRTRAAVRHVDHLIQRIITETEKLGLSEMLNIVLVSDHGMEYCSPVFVIDMSRYIVSADVVRFKEDGAMLWIWPADNKIMQVYKHVTSFVKTFNSERFEGVYLRKDIPEKYRLGLSYRASPILVVARPGTYLLPPGQDYPTFVNSSGQKEPYHGCNGYDARYEEMKAVFIAKGPDFKLNREHGPIKTVDVYQILRYLLRLDPVESEGVWSRVEDMFVTSNNWNVDKPESRASPQIKTISISTHITGVMIYMICMNQSSF